MFVPFFSFVSLADDDLVILPSSDYSFYSSGLPNRCGLSDLPKNYSSVFKPAYFFNYAEGSQFDSFFYDNSLNNSAVTCYLFYSQESFIDAFDTYGKEQSTGGIIASFPMDSFYNIATVKVSRNSVLDLSEYFDEYGYYLLGTVSDYSRDTIYLDSPVTVTNYRASSPSPTQSRLIFYKFNVNEGDSIYPSHEFYVSPQSIDMYASNEAINSYTYALNYRVELPSRFYYPQHVGSALSNPVVTSDINIKSTNFNRDGYIMSFGSPVVSLDTDHSHDVLNTLSFADRQIDGSIGYSIMDMPVQNDISVNTYQLVVEWTLYLTVSDSSYPAIMFNSPDYECVFTIDSVTYHGDSGFQHLTNSSDGQILEDIYQEQVKQHEEEIDKANEASDAVTEGVTQITDTLSSWEIFTMPVTLVTEFVQAISGDGSSSFTFPSYSMMGYEIWPAYTFDLNVIAERFPLLYNSLHLISGILIVIAFIRYLWRKWSILTGDDMPEGEVK